VSWLWIYAALFGASVLWEILWGQGRRLRTWSAAVKSCGLRVVETSSLWRLRTSLKAQTGQVEVQIEYFLGGEGRARIGVLIPWPLSPLGVTIRRQQGAPGAREIEIGDESFDNAFTVEGASRLAFALLDVEVRHLLFSVETEFRQCQLTIADGRLQVELPDRQIHLFLPVLLDLRRRLVQSQDVTQRLVDHALRDPSAGVRLRNLVFLVREFHEDPRTIEALRAACTDMSPKVRLRAAKELGAEGRGVLVELAESTEDDACSAQALQVVGRELPIERTRAILAHALRRRRVETARGCLEVLGHSGGAADVDLLAKVVARERSELATAAAEALGETGSTAAEPPLIEALRRDWVDLQVAAATALGRVGSAVAVLPLKQAAERSAHEPDLRRATRQAIAEIQSRLPGASPGQLSLAGAEAGQLSLAQAETGELALAQTEAGQLSLTADADGQLSLPPEKTGELSLGGDAEGPERGTNEVFPE
jgi:HEAT repeat protein